MATVNFSVPEEVKQAFNSAFLHQNKSAVITSLMIRAIEEQKLRAKRARAIDSMLARRREKPESDAEEIQSAREVARP